MGSILSGLWQSLLPFKAGELQGSPLTFRRSQGLPEYLSEAPEKQ
jgi:hypothetical protein